MDPSVLPEERLEGFSVTVSKGDNFTSLKAGHGLKVGDFLVLRGKNYKIMDIHPDDCFTSIEGSRNMVYVENKFESNIKDQCFRFRRTIYLKGSLVEVKSTDMNRYRINISFREKINNSHGIMELYFSCAVFNGSGFYTRSLAITEVEIM